MRFKEHVGKENKILFLHNNYIYSKLVMNDKKYNDKLTTCSSANCRASLFQNCKKVFGVDGWMRKLVK